MASLFKKKGQWAIQFIAGERRPIIYVGKAEKAARGILAHVERLINATIDRQPVTRETAEWVGSIGSSLHRKLVKAGLVQAREEVAPTQLAAFLDGYVKGRTDLKERSRANLTQARNGLVEHFGAKRDLKTITRGEMGDWHRSIKARLAKATVAGHVKRARMFFADALNRKLITENPMTGIEAGHMTNRERFVYVTAEMIESVIGACPDAEWRLIFALARYGGLRVPSESNALRWSDVNWEQSRMTVRASKTAHHSGGGTRVVPIFPELLPHLRDAFEQAEAGENRVIVKHRGENLRTRAEKIIGRAGLVPWAKLFQNLRSSCETDLTNSFPLHVACAWIGNSEAVAAKHYLQVTDDHFATAVGKSAAPGAAPTDQKGAKQPAPEVSKPRIYAGFDTNSVPPRVVELSKFSAEKLGVSKKVLRQALHRLKIASPYLYQREVLRLRLMAGQGGGR
jgi:integrase